MIVQAHGGEALEEILLDRAVQARLKQEGIALEQSQIDAERQRVLAALATDPDQAARLMKEMRAQRGLDDVRFGNLLRRNAGLRTLVSDKITINEAATRQAYQLRYGDRYQVRLITSGSLDQLTRARRLAVDSATFTKLAIEISTDRSMQQGGLLSPVSPADPTYPKAIRDALPKLKVDNTASRLSPIIALDQGYALLWLEEVIKQADPPGIEQVRDELAAAVRDDLESVRMRQLARTLIEQTNVVVLDPALDKSWRQQFDSLQAPE